MAQVWKSESPEEREQVVVTRQGNREHRERVIERPGQTRRETAYILSQLIWLAFGILEGLILLRIGLKLIAANPANPFASLVYGITEVFLWPFFGLTGTPAYSGFVLEISSIIALFVYALLGWVLVKIAWLLFYRTPSTPVIETYDEEVR